MGSTLILTGRPAVGKTTLIKSVVKQLEGQAGGFYSEEISGPGGRKGFRLITLDGQSGVMAHVDINSRSRIVRYGVDVAAIDRIGVTAIREAIERKPIVVIDEIGKMEMFSPQFQAIVLKAVSSPKMVIAAAMIDNHPWVAALKALPNVTVWEVTKENRSERAEQVLKWINSVSSRKSSGESSRS
jgi:nucleoside-triphosphatase